MTRAPRTTRTLRAAAWAALLAFLLAACSGSAPGETTAPAGSERDTEAGTEAATATEAAASGEIEVVLTGGPTEIAAYEELVAAFEESQDDIDVALTPVADAGELLATLTTAFAGGQPPDAFLANYQRYGRFTEALAPVGPLLEASDVISRDEFAETALTAFERDGELQCMPQNVSSLVLYYNADLFEAAGVEPPADDWTWDELLAAAQELTDPDADTWGLGVEPAIQRIAPFVWSNGGEVVDDSAQPTTLSIDEGPAREALDFVLDLQLEHGVVPPDAAEQSEDSETRFIGGRLGMLLDSRRAVPTLREGIGEGFVWDAARLPSAPGGDPTSILHGDGFCLAADGNVAAAWRFVEFAMTAGGQEILAASGRTVPSRLDVADSPVFLEPEEPPASSDVFLEQIPDLRALPSSATWAAVASAADDLLVEIFYGRVEREQGIAQLIEATRPLFAEGG